MRILATDISTRALRAAERGIYPAERFSQMPKAMVCRYLLRGQGAAAGYFRVRPEIRARVEFRRLNLVEEFRHEAPFPVIFCRNVMIYFNQETRRDVVARLIDSLEPGGYLIVGHAESLGNRGFALDYVQPAVYRKAGAAGRGAMWKGGRRWDI